NSGQGGGIYINGGGALTLTNSTISGNSATGGVAGFNFGGGIYINTGGTLTIANSTLNGNSATGGSNANIGAAVANFGTLTIINSTLSGNSASGGNNLGGGVYNDSGTVQSRNTIIAQNTAATGPDVDGALTSQGHNLIGNTSGATVTAATGDLFDAAAAPLNLGPVANNGGPTQTMALLSGSVAIDAGDNCVTDVAHCSDANIPQLTSDQRGAGYPRK